MEILKLSKFKLQLQALISEDVKQLKENERLANDQVQHLIQKQKLRDEEFGRKINDLQSELSLSNGNRRKLDKKVNCLESESETLENNQKEWKETISGLLQSKESFVKIYEQNLQEALSAKEIVIQNLILEKQALCFEVGNLGFAMKKIQDAVSRMDEEDRKAFSSMLDELEERATIRENEVECMEDVETNGDHNISNKGAVENSASPECRNCSGIKSLEEDSNLDVCVPEVQPGFSQPQLAMSPESKFAKEQLTGRE